MAAIAVIPPARRLSVRRAVRVACVVRSELWDGAIPLETRDLSPDGLWLTTDLPLEPGERLVISLRPPQWPFGARPIRVQGEVVRAQLHRRRSDRKGSGMGVRFLDTAPDVRTLLARSLRGLPPPLPVRTRERLAHAPTTTPEARLRLDDGTELSLCALSPLLTAGRPESDDALPAALRTSVPILRLVS